MGKWDCFLNGFLLKKTKKTKKNFNNPIFSQILAFKGTVEQKHDSLHHDRV